MNKSFLETYVEDAPADLGIRGLAMNAPYVQPNGLADIGIEIEVEGRRLPTAGALDGVRAEKSGATWQVKPDHSLRNNGVEYVVSTPVYPEEVDQMVDGLWERMKANGSVIQPSNRTSTHVHVNVGGKRINQLTAVICLWTTLEEPLINWCGEERVNNHFCLSSKEHNRLIFNWDYVLQRGRVDWSEGMKYSALNMRTMRELGSIEFRTMRLDKDPAPLKDWIKFIDGMSKFAFSRYEDPRLLAADMSEQGGRTLFLDICAKSGVSPAFGDSVLSHSMNENFETMTMEGFRRAQPLLFSYPWGEWLPLIKKEYIPSPFVKLKESKRRRIEDIDWGEPPRGARARFDALDAGFLEANPAAEVIAPAPRAQRARMPVGPRNPGLRVDVTQPVCFGDGTPAVIVEVREEFHIFSVSARGNSEFWDYARVNAGAWFYDIETGLFNGGANGHPWVINVDQYEAIYGVPPRPPIRRHEDMPVNPGEPVNPALPLEFGDGTPAELTAPVRAGSNEMYVRSVGDEDRDNPWFAEMRVACFYYLSNGVFGGTHIDNRNHPWIRNVPQEIA